MQPETIHLIREAGQLDSHAKGILSTPAVGIDTEFVRERTYLPRPGLVQLSDGRRVWLIDPVELGDRREVRSRLWGLMARADSTKVLHSTGEDLEVLELLCAGRPRPLFDTQLAAALLGWPLQVRYEVLAHDLLDAEFPGGLGRNDWCRRPLPPAWIEYAANDVIALPAMHERLAGRLEAAGRAEWHREDCQRLVDGFGAQTEPLLRIKGAASLDDEALERLARLAEWRERQARKRNLPRGFVVPDPALVALAAMPRHGDSGPALPEALRHGRGARHRDALLELHRDEPQPFRRPPELVPLSPQQRARIKTLQGRVRAIAEELGIEPAVLASKRELTRHVQGARCDWLEGWRGGILADALA